jgi:hypothetical protein
VIALPPLAGAVQVILSTPADGLDAVGAAGVAGTVVAVTVVVPEAGDVPAALVAVTDTVYTTADAKPVIVSGEADPVAVLVV